MFTGIVEDRVTVASVEESGTTVRLSIERPSFHLSENDLGQSYSVNGVCLTLASLTSKYAQFDLIQSTLEKSNLSNINSGQLLNIEQSHRTGESNGGHNVSGHVDCIGTLHLTEGESDSPHLYFLVPDQKIKYIFSQGFVAINGVSLTINTVHRTHNEFSVWIIPETVQRTNIGLLKDGDTVNLEFDKTTQIIVDTISETIKSVMAKD